VRFRIEYLTETTDENSVCHAKVVGVFGLDEAKREAWLAFQPVRTLFGANGFQIRDIERGGEIVALEDGSGERI
jgi:hypothetical protein